jgi:hypothetical protein
MVRANLPWSSNTAIVASGSGVTVSGPIRLSTYIRPPMEKLAPDIR